METVSLSFVSLLQDLFRGIFNSVLAPVLRDVASILINLAKELISEIFSNFLLKIWITLLKLIAFMEKIFDVFAGKTSIGLDGKSANMTLLDYFFQLNDIQKIFWAFTMISVVLVFVASAIGIAKSMSDMILENKNPISQVLREATKAATTFVIIPITCLFALQMITQVTVVLDKSINYKNADADISDMIFIASASEAAKSQTSLDRFSSGNKYEDAEDLKAHFNIKKINYVIAYTGSFLVGMLLLCCILQFIQRVFMILLLYISSPFFVAYMPLDNGAKFKKWREYFVAHMISAFGPILCMKLYFMIVPFLVNQRMNFGVTGIRLSCVKLILVIGGAYAVYKSRYLLISIVSPSAAGGIAESGFIGGLIAGKLMSGAGKVKQKIAKQNTNQSGGDGGKQGSSASSGEQAFKGK